MMNEYEVLKETPDIKLSTILNKGIDVTVREEAEADGKYMLFNAENEMILVTNPTGKFILDGCDGIKTVADILADMREKYELDENLDLLDILKKYLALLFKAQLIKIKEEKE